MIRVFRGISKDPQRTAGEIIANGYMAGSIAIDAPEGVLYPNPSLILLTHGHCDHIVGLLRNNCPVGASEFTADAIELGREEATLCNHLNFPPVRRDIAHRYREGDSIEGDGFSLQVVETPGHSAGSLCFYLPEKKYLFSGDTVFGGGALPSVSLPTSNPSALMGSYEKLDARDIEKFFPGHGEPFSESGYIRRLMHSLRAIQP